MSAGEFSVYQFLDGDVSEQVRDHVSMEEACQAFFHYTRNPAAQIGITRRVIITDGDDFTNMEWLFGEGITYPTKAMGLKCSSR